jgi:hypothetical protein
MSQQGVKRRIPWAVPAAGVFVVAGEILWFLLSLFIAAMKCDEGCSDYDPGVWSDTVNAWQWGAFWVVSGIGLLCAIAAVAFAIRDRARATAVAFGMSAAAIVVWGAIYSSGF